MLDAVGVACARVRVRSWIVWGKERDEGCGLRLPLRPRRASAGCVLYSCMRFSSGVIFLLRERFDQLQFRVYILHVESLLYIPHSGPPLCMCLYTVRERVFSDLARWGGGGEPCLRLSPAPANLARLSGLSPAAAPAAAPCPPGRCPHLRLANAYSHVEATLNEIAHCHGPATARQLTAKPRRLTAQHLYRDTKSSSRSEAP